MRAIRQGRTVAFLRPTGTGIADQMELEQSDNVDASHKIRLEKLNDDINQVRELIEETAKRLFMILQVYEYLLPETNVPSRAASKWIYQSNLITTVNPDDNQLSYIADC